MAIPQSVAEVLKSHVTLEVEGIDRMYLNLYVPRLQHERGVVGFFRYHRGHQFASSALMAPMTKGFVGLIESFVEAHGVRLITFEKGDRKDDVVKPYFADFEGEEGVVVVGKAQEKTRVLRTVKRRNASSGKSYAWLVPSTAMVNHYYFYIFDRDFGPLFVKFCSYFPYNGKVCLNGHEYAKRQLEKRGIDYEALDNGVRRCAEPRRLQKICDGLGEAQIDAVVQKWLGRLPQPFTRADRAAGYRYALSILQAEFSLTQVLDRPVTGRIFFEQVIRENLDLGRPDQVQLIFGRGGDQADAGALSHPRAHRRRDPFAARRLQAQPHQAVPQGGARAAHRDHDQQHARLRHRQAAPQPRRAAAGRLSSQPTTAGRRTHQP